MDTENSIDKSEQKLMSLYDHLDELRKRLVYCLISLVAFFLVTWPFAGKIINYLKRPLLAATELAIDLNYTGPFDVFFATIKVSILTAVVFSCPVWIYQLWKFVEPALYEEEKKYIFPFTLASIFLFLFGVLFSYFFIFPLTLQFMIGLGQDVANPMITIRDYLGLLILMVLGFGLIFELPILLILFAKLDLIDHTSLSKNRSIIVVLLFVVAAIFTPPDPISQVAMALPLWLMFEISILIIKYTKRT